MPLDLSQVEQSQVRNSFTSKALAVGLNMEATQILLFADGKQVGSLDVSAMTYNEFTFQDGNKSQSLQYLKMAKGKKGVEMNIIDDEGNIASDARVGECLLKIAIDNTAVMEAISKAHNIALKA